MQAVRTLAVPFVLTACAAPPAEPSGPTPTAAAAEEEPVFRAERPTDRETVLTRSFAAPRARVFAALTEPALLAEWLAATGFRFAAGEVDLRVGGSLRYVFERASGRRIEVRGQFESVDPPRSFSYRESYDFSPLVVHVRTELGEHGGATTLRQVLTYDSQAERDTDFPGVAASSREAFERLARLLASG